MTKEQKLQSEIVVAYNNKYPKNWGRLFHVSNERSHKKQAFIAKAIGIVPGVSDLIYLSKKRRVATELKIDGSRHELSTVKNQIKWGKVWEGISKKHHWRMCFTKEQALNCYKGNYQGYTIEQAEDYVKNIKTKTFKIEWK